MNQSGFNGMSAKGVEHCSTDIHARCIEMKLCRTLGGVFVG